MAAWVAARWQSLHLVLFGFIGSILDRTDRKTAEPAVAVLRIDTTAVEVQVSTAGGGVERARPGVAI